MKKQLSILGSTGSIGQNVLNIVAMFPERYSVAALAAKENTALLAEQIQQFHPEVVSVFDKGTAAELKQRVHSNSSVRIVHGDDGYREAATHDTADMVVSAMVGASGLFPTLAAIESGKEIALANKETLVMAGDIVMKQAEKKNIRILPVDSEHSAIFQCLSGQRREDLDRISKTEAQDGQ